MKKIADIFLIVGLFLISAFIFRNIQVNQEQNKWQKAWQKRVSQSRKQQKKRFKFLKVEKRGPQKNQLGLLVVPKINLRQVVLYDATAGNLAYGPSLIKGTAFPGTRGKAVIAGHRVTYTHPFRNIGQLKKGDRIIFSNSSGSFTYKVNRIYRVTPDTTSVLKPASQPQLLLLTCDPPYKATYRLIVAAKGT